MRDAMHRFAAVGEISSDEGLKKANLLRK